MIVIADASPLNYLIQVQCEHLLRDLYGRVFVPSAVIEELRHPSAPSAVAAWLQQVPAWIEVRTVSPKKDAALEVLDLGERAAIQLAEEQGADLLLIDERRGRLEAKKRGIPTMGTLGILLAAGARNWIDAEVVFRRIVNETTFRATPEIQESFLRQCRKPGTR